MGASTLRRGGSRLPAPRPHWALPPPQPPHRQAPPARVLRPLLRGAWSSSLTSASCGSGPRQCPRQELPSGGACLGGQRCSPGRAARPLSPPGSRWTPRSLALLTGAGGVSAIRFTLNWTSGASVLRHEALDLGLRPPALGHVKRPPPFPAPLPGSLFSLWPCSRAC